MRLLSYAVCGLLALGYVACGLAWGVREQGLGNGWASVAVACVLVTVGIGAAMIGRTRKGARG
jgi:hypothetical protein